MKIRRKDECGCGTAPNVVVCCSGAADTAEIGDRAARLLNREGTAKMSCLAGIGGSVDKIVDNVKKSLLILAVDGCDTDCSRRVLEQAGIKEFIHLRVIDLGMVKGETPVTEERIQQVAAKARDLLGVDALSL
jgi:uncharacterized metal-binding protein